MTSIDEKNLLVFNPETASIIFTAGEGILTKSKKIIASLTQALILFSDKVVDQEINFIRFQNHRMVFIHEQDLYGVKLVPKDQLTKNFVPSIKIILNIQNQLRKLDSNIKELADEPVRKLYNLLTKPEQNLYIFPESIEGYLGLLTMMAALNYDLSINLESIKENFIILKEESLSTLKELELSKYNGLFSFGFNVNSVIDSNQSIEIIQMDLKDSIFNVIFPNNKSLHKLLSQIIGTESSAYIISQIINREQSINEVALSLVKLPETTMAVAIAIEAITNFSKEQRLAKPLYRIIIKKLKDLEGAIDETILPSQEQPKPEISISNEPEPQRPLEPTAVPESFQSKGSEFEVPKKEENPALQNISSQEKTSPEPQTHTQSGFSSSELTSLANEFTSKLENLTKSEAEEPSFNQVSIQENKNVEAQSFDTDSLKIDKNHMFMENFKIYFDLAPFRLGLKPESINYRPSIQIVRVSNETSKIIVRLSPNKHDWFLDILKTLSETIELEYQGDKGVFEITTNNNNLNNVFRISIWSAIIEMTYAIQNGERELPDIFNITNKSNLCIILDLPPERRKQLPSQIEDIVEEEKLLQGSGVEDLIKSLDKTLVTLSNALKSKKGVGFVLRKDSNELPLVLEWVLTLSEISGIGWSRW